MRKEKITTVSIRKEDSDYIEDLQYLLRKNIKIDLTKHEVLSYVLRYIHKNEKDFLEYVKKLNSQS